MDAASILIFLATAGQSGWTPEQTNTTPVTISAAPNSGRYGAPAAPTAEQVQSWAQQQGQQQLDAAGNALRDAGNRAAGAVNNQLQQYTSPFTTGSTPAATNTAQPTAASSRGALAPPPWDSSDLESGFSDNAPQTTAAAVPADPTRSAGMTPTRTDSGWTSIGPSVAAPPLLVPRLATSNPTIGPPPAQTPASVAATSPSFATSSVNREPVTTVANSGSQPPPTNGWDDYRNSQPSIASNNQTQPFNNTVSAPTLLAPNGNSHTLNLPDPPSTQQSPPAGGFGSFSADDSRWDQKQNAITQPQLNAPAPQISQPRNDNVLVLGNRGNSQLAQPPAATVPPLTITGGQFSSGNNTVAANRQSDTTPIIGRSDTTNNANSTLNKTSDKPTEEQPPWLPLLFVSLALAGSVSANFFLGWSYMDARQKYQMLVRKTADTFRRVASAA